MRALVGLFFVGTFFAGTSCGKHGYSRDDLNLAVMQYHIDLRWGRLENAAAKLDAPLRTEFLRTWAERLQVAELQNLEILGVTVDDSGDRADVVVMVTVLSRADMMVTNQTVTEVWQRTDQGWRCTQPFSAS
jgi:hypothetical protein